MEVPPPSANRGGEEVNNLAGGAWRGLEESWGLWENFYFSFYFHPRSLFSFTWELGSGWACLDQFLADPSGTRGDKLDESESFVT